MNSILGKWEIIEMEHWDKDFIDLIEPGSIDFKKDGLGSFNFGAVFTEIDYRISTLDQLKLIEFSFSGEDEGNPILGRAKLTLKNTQLTGKIYVHNGDESELVAVPFR